MRNNGKKLRKMDKIQEGKASIFVITHGSLIFQHLTNK